MCNVSMMLAIAKGRSVSEILQLYLTQKKNVKCFHLYSTISYSRKNNHIMLSAEIKYT